MDNESRIINELHAQFFERFKVDGCEVESVVTVVLFKSTTDQRTYHIAQAVADDAQDVPGELFCESAGRLEMAAHEVAAKRRRL